ncbi:hypothetical protein CU098_005963 [Rhizopus stolonifer]|uniref:Uncharacterized protein n=1 Tax=Rhizopus stolonifer TaxID=4846 RepID=A0A367IUS2_RHIST|nr:hypothetical protein CU098_005963 [Rhizopus stolonifer]
MEKAHDDSVSKLARDMVVRNIDRVKMEAYIKDFKNEDAATLCYVLSNLSGIYSADYSTNDVNEATPVINPVKNLFKMYFASTTLTKSVGDGSLFFFFHNSAKRFIELDPSLNTCSKRAEFFVISKNVKHVILPFKSKPNKTKGVNDLIKLCRELKGHD